MPTFIVGGPYWPRGAVSGGSLAVPAELEPHRRKQAVGELALAPRAEPLVERCREDRHRHRLVDRGGDRPASLTGVGDAAGEVLPRRAVVQCLCGAVEGPRGER